MTTPGAARLFRRAAGSAAALAAVGAVLFGAAGAAVAADPVFAEGDCVIYRMSDNGPQNAQCAGMDLTGDRFGEGDFRGADLQGASFAGGDVQGAVFTGANLAGADFSEARIVGADFTGSSILPGTVDLVADAGGMAPLPIEVQLPTGLTLDGCSIVNTPIESGQTFPIGTSNILCTFSTAFSGVNPGTGTAVITVHVTASPTATPTSTPLFTPAPVTDSAAPGADAGGDEPNWLMVGGFIGGGVLVAGGIAAFVVSNRASRRAG